MTGPAAIGPFGTAEIQRFIRDGYLRLDGVFTSAVAAAARAILWRDLACDPARPESWTRPNVRLGYYDQEPFRQAVAAARLHAALDQLAGRGRWRLPRQIGSFVVRFPSAHEPADHNWHLDISFPGPDADPAKPQDYSSWRVNLRSRDRWLVLLLLFSDVTEADAPTRFRVGSHRTMARVLAPAGEAGLFCQRLDDVATDCPEALATGPAGTAYLCHPFLVHAAQRNRGTQPRFIAQPAVLPVEPVSLRRADGDYAPVELAIRAALGDAPLPEA